MSNIDKRALREAAEKATPGVWVYLPQNTSIEYDYGSDDSQGSVTYMDSGDFTQKQTDLNGAFIAAANPATVLALLDELEAADKRIAELEARTLVPVDPTLDQLVAGKRRLTSTGRMSRLMSQRLAEVYRAMVSAAAAGKGE